MSHRANLGHPALLKIAIRASRFILGSASWLHNNEPAPVLILDSACAMKR